MTTISTGKTHVKEVVRRHWTERAADYDEKVHHSIHSDEQHAAWRNLIDRYIGEAPKEVLDVGCGTGFLSLLAAELNHRVTGVDFSPTMLERARAKAAQMGYSITFKEGDAEAPDVPDSAFDVVMERHVVWTLPNPEDAIRTWMKSLRPGGKVILFEGTWRSNTQPQPQYEPIVNDLPFYGGVDSETLKALFNRVGLKTELVEETNDAVLWGEEGRRTRYVIVATRP